MESFTFTQSAVNKRDDCAAFQAEIGIKEVEEEEEEKKKNPHLKMAPAAFLCKNQC